ncbi:AAA family ATPase [Pseudonocardia sp. CA-142604]|uniref:helix-turn-helix transcriptional regulator n=1 Tax=Pseudonocardia sp. CA-142604 TaxID=3240024 RepID=UPI003D90F0BA
MHHVRCPALVGRHAELAVLVELLGAARRGAGTVVFLSGDPGIGKSRMAREVFALAGTTGLPAVVGRAVPGASSAPLRPLVEATLALARRHGLPDRSELGPYAAVLGPLVPEWATGAPTTSGPVLAEGLLRLLRLVAPRGCVVVLEDLHWADPETLALLEYLGDHIADTGVLLLATLRSGEGDQAWAVSDALAARGSALPLPLTALDDAGVAEMVRACGLDPAAAAPVTAQADGVPLMVEELLGDYDSTITCGSTTVPRSLADSVRRRVAGLGQVDGSVLAAAALLGRRFDWRLVAEALELDATTMTAALASATGAGLLEPDGAGYRFRHALTRDAVLAGLSGPLQAEMAAALGRVLRRRSPELPGEAALLAADLAELAGDPSAADLLACAGARAARDGALDSAGRLLTRGLALARPAATRVALADSLADVRCRAGDPDAAAAATAELMAELRSAPDETVRRRAHLRLARAAAEAGRWELAEVQLAAAAVPTPHCPTEHGLTEHGPVRHESDAPEADLVRALVLLGRNARAAAAALASGVVDPALAAGRPDVACEALQVVGRAERTADPDEALAAFEKAHAIAVAHDLPLGVLSALHELGTIDLFRTGRRDRLEAARAAAVAAGAARLVVVLDLDLGASHLMNGDPDAARAAAASARDGAAALGLDQIHVIALGMVPCAAALRADRVGVERDIAAIPAGALDADADAEAGIWGFARGVCSLLAEDRAAAVRELETAFTLTADAAEVRPLMWWGCWALLRAVEGRDAEAAIEALRTSPAVVNRHNAAFADLAEAVLAGRRGHGEQAAAVVSSFGPRELPWPWLRHLARRLVAEAALADGWGDPLSWAAEAGEFFDRFDTSAIADACRALAASPRAGNPPVPVWLRQRGVTPREAEVLDLLGAGLTTTRELASKLVISPRTVEKHVEALCRKLDVRARGQLVALAARRAGDGAPVRAAR